MKEGGFSPAIRFNPIDRFSIFTLLTLLYVRYCYYFGEGTANKIKLVFEGRETRRIGDFRFAEGLLSGYGSACFAFVGPMKILELVPISGSWV
jgi:hypothetical protein